MGRARRAVVAYIVPDEIGIGLDRLACRENDVEAASGVGDADARGEIAVAVVTVDTNRALRRIEFDLGKDRSDRRHLPAAGCLERTRQQMDRVVGGFGVGRGRALTGETAAIGAGEGGVGL